MSFEHLPVLPKETLELLDIQPGHIVVDTTCGGGGHLMLMAQAALPNGVVVGIDRDQRAFLDDAAGKVRKTHGERVHLVQARFSELPKVLKELGISRIDRLLCDLGVSSEQLDNENRGFSFLRDGPFDMRMNPLVGLTAYELVESLSEKELADTIYQFGEERYSRRIAKVLKENAPLANSTLSIADLIARTVGRRERIHPATRTFQALRIAVNEELFELGTLLNNLPSLLNVGGRAAFISFHSLEDRMVKHSFKKAALLSKSKPRAFQILTKKPIIASNEETAANPRSRSAKLRGIERVTDEDIEGSICELLNI